MVRENRRHQSDGEKSDNDRRSESATAEPLARAAQPGLGTGLDGLAAEEPLQVVGQFLGRLIPIRRNRAMAWLMIRLSGLGIADSSRCGAAGCPAVTCLTNW